MMCCVLYEEGAYLGMLRGACMTKWSGINTRNRKAPELFFRGRDNTSFVGMYLYAACLEIRYAYTAWLIL